MIKYEDLPHTIGTSANHDTQAVNDSAYQAKDGTGWQAAIPNQNWGFQQAVLKNSFQVANGTDESADASQVLDGIREISGAKRNLLANANLLDRNDPEIVTSISGDTNWHKIANHWYAELGDTNLSVNIAFTTKGLQFSGTVASLGSNTCIKIQSGLSDLRDMGSNKNLRNKYFTTGIEISQFATDVSQDISINTEMPTTLAPYYNLASIDAHTGVSQGNIDNMVRSQLIFKVGSRKTSVIPNGLMGTSIFQIWPTKTGPFVFYVDYAYLFEGTAQVNSNEVKNILTDYRTDTLDYLLTQYMHKDWDQQVDIQGLIGSYGQYTPGNQTVDLMFKVDWPYPLTYDPNTEASIAFVGAFQGQSRFPQGNLTPQTLIWNAVGGIGASIVQVTRSFIIFNINCQLQNAVAPLAGQSTVNPQVASDNMITSASSIHIVHH